MENMKLKLNHYLIELETSKNLAEVLFLTKKIVLINNYKLNFSKSLTIKTVV